VHLINSAAVDFAPRLTSYREPDATPFDRTEPTIDTRAHRLHRARNLLQSALLILGMAAIAAACAWTLWGRTGIVWAFALVAVLLALSPSLPPGLVLSLYRARPIARAEFPDGYAIVDELARRAGLPAPPTLHYIASSTLNAFAVGARARAAIALSDGILRALTRREIAGVLAHEISHIRANDLWIMNLADTMSRLTGWLSYFGMILLILSLPLWLAGGPGVPWLLVLLLMAAPTLMSLLQLALSRAREYDADLGAAELTGDPAGLASALEKLERRQGRFWEEILFPGRRIPDPSLLRTHPPTAERIARLMRLAGPAAPPLPAPPRGYAIPVTWRHVSAPPRWRWPGMWY